MSITSGEIFLNELRFHAYHGVLPQERKVGADYTVTLRVACDLQQAAATDDLSATLDYARLYDVVRQEMARPSALLEHVAGRIGRAVMTVFPQVTAVDVSVTKLNPPMGADGAGAGVTLRFINDQ